MTRHKPAASVAPTLIQREHAHRRLLLLGMSVLLLLSVAPTLGHHIYGGMEEAIGSIQHLGAFCAAALRVLLNPIHGAFHLALVAGLAYGLWDRFVAWRSLKSILRSLEATTPTPGTPVWRAAAASGVDPFAIRVVRGLPNPAFTAGLLAPRIYVSSALGHRLSQAELDCVIAHEAAHVRRKDPLRLSTYRFLSCILFWLPVLRGLASDMADEAEIQADTEAGHDAPLALASAILQLSAVPYLPVPAGSLVRFHNPDLLDRRIRRLAGENPPLPTRLSRTSLTLAGFAVALVLFSGLAAAQAPTTDATHEENHCRHHHGSLWSHLWCTSGDCNDLRGHCDHSR